MRNSLLMSVGCSVPAEIAGCGCPEIDVRIERFVVLQVSRSYFENASADGGSVLQVMSIRIVRKECGAISRAIQGGHWHH